MSTINILAFAGSNRRESVNRKLINAAAQLGKEAGIEVTVADLNDYDMPIYNGDIEESQGLPPAALAFKKLIHAHDAVLMASPEYNASVTALLKNTIDWCSRPGGEDDPGKVLNGKVVGLLSASPGGLGGIRALNHLRAILLNVSAFVIPAQFALGGAMQAFDDDGNLKEESAREAVLAVLKQLVDTAQALSHSKA